ncbi:MAG: DUF5009 domain-containing protein [Cytophagaceae bacterium]|nr:DUF5009 domain-containing protein [Cytophagaceae bacterium]
MSTESIAPPTRLASADVYRGFVMFLMMAEVLRLCTVAETMPGSAVWAFLCYHQSHVEWQGCALHDLIQPSFTFLVGVVLPFSLAARRGTGAKPVRETRATPNASTEGIEWPLFRRALRRSLVLVVLGIFLRSLHSEQTNFTFEDTLTQIGLGYPFLFLLGYAPPKGQWVALAVILVGYWLAFALFPLPEGFNYKAVDVPADWPHHTTGFAAHWTKNSNLAWAFDTWFLNLFPREKTFLFNGGGYATLSFIPTLATMVLGLQAGNWLRRPLTHQQKLRGFAVLGLAGLLLGWLLDATGICPNVKRIWTPAWVLFSGGWCALLLALFYAVVDVWRVQKSFFIWKVIGMNSIAAYVLADTLTGFWSRSLHTHLGQGYDQVFGEAYAPVVNGFFVLAIEILILYTLYRQRIFIRI